jgi:hypothetical protein
MGTKLWGTRRLRVNLALLLDLVTSNYPMDVTFSVSASEDGLLIEDPTFGRQRTRFIGWDAITEVRVVQLGAAYLSIWLSDGSELRVGTTERVSIDDWEVRLEKLRSYARRAGIAASWVNHR